MARYEDGKKEKTRGAYLLTEHDDGTCKRGTSVTRDGKHLKEAETAPLDLLLLLEQAVGEVEIARSLKFRVTKDRKGSESFHVTVALHEPTR